MAQRGAEASEGLRVQPSDTCLHGLAIALVKALHAQQAQIAGTFAQDEILGRPHEYWYGYRERIEAVTAEHVLAAARRRLRPDEIVTLVVGKWSEIEPGDAEGRATMAQFADRRVEHLPLRDPLTLSPLPAD